LICGAGFDRRHKTIVCPTGLETGQFLGRVFVGTLDVFHAALKAREGAVGADVNLAERAVRGHVGETVILILPNLGVGAGETAHLPITADEDVNVEAFLRGDWGIGREVFVSEGLEVGGIFAANDGGLSIDAGFQGIHADGGLALNRARSRTLLCVEAVGLNLFQT